MGFIYLIRNLINGKGYIGQTAGSVARRFSLHKSRARNGSRLALHCAMRKYGVANFSVVEIVRCDHSLLNDLETHYIKHFSTYIEEGSGYNMTSGGDSPTSISECTRQKQSASRIGVVPWNKGKRGLQVPKRGPMPEEMKAKIRTTMKGRTVPASVRSLAIAINTGRARSEETKRKISDAKIGKRKGVPWTQARRDAQARRSA